MNFEISINGQPFYLWKTAMVQRSIDSNAGGFRFTNSSTTPISDYPVKVGDLVEILIDEQSKIKGYIDNISGRQTTDQHELSVSGRDLTQDLVDSSVPDAAKVTDGPISLQGLCQKIIKGIGGDVTISSVVDDMADFTSADLQAASSGETCMSYLVSFARKRQVYLVSDGAGGLIIYRPDATNKASSPLIHQIDSPNNNVVAYSFRKAGESRFNKYLCRSQDNFGFDESADYAGSGTDRKNSVTDSTIRESRYLEIMAEQSMTDAECLERANEEANLRRAQSVQYTCTVPGVSQYNGDLWDFGLFVDVYDEYADITGQFLIKSVRYNVDMSTGTTTQIECVPPDAYQVIANETTKNKRKSSTGSAFT